MHILFKTFYRTFAYLTVKDRMPRILTQVVDTVNREEKTISDAHGVVRERPFNSLEFYCALNR